MRTLITPGHVRDVVAQRITQAQASAVRLGPIRADVAYDGTVNLRPRGEVTTAQEAAALHAMLAVTDVVAWRGDRRPIAPTCLLCGTGGALTHELCARCARVVSGAVA